jgi:RNA polymerase sigma-70 factor (ECF subfamily)
LDEAELLAAARDGDRSAFEELVRQTYVDTYTLACRLTGNEEDARDVVQEAYLRAWKSIRRFRGDAMFSTWMYRITANAASTATHRRRRTATETLDDSAALLVDERPASDPVISAESNLLQTQVSAALQQLPPKLRAVVVLKDVYDLPHEEIAKELGISVPAAKVRLHRARRQLREVLFDDTTRRARAV